LKLFLTTFRKTKKYQVMKSIESSRNQAKSYLIHLLNGNQLMSQQLLEGLVQQIPIYIIKMESALNENNIDIAAEYASKIKSAFALLRSTDLEMAYENAFNSEDNKELHILKDRINVLKLQSFEFLNNLTAAA
jgi:HPt (histidine-containing phosphotransfer) domain-containing protein